MVGAFWALAMDIVPNNAVAMAIAARAFIDVLRLAKVSAVKASGPKKLHVPDARRALRILPCVFSGFACDINGLRQ